MKRARNVPLTLGLLLAWATPAYPQSTQNPPPSPSAASADCFKGTVTQIQNAFNKSKADGMALVSTGAYKRWPEYICYLTTDQTTRSRLIGKAEQNRQDKQPGATSNSSGSTSLVSKGSSPWLLGFALEHGGLTQTTAGNTITFRGNATNSIRALLKSTYRGSYQVAQDDPVVQFLSKLSFGISFDAQGNQPSTTQGFTPTTKNFSGFSAKYEIIDHRDPRDKKWNDEWNSIAVNLASNVADPLGKLDAAITNAAHFHDNWDTPIAEAFGALPDLPTTAQILRVFQDAGDLFGKLYWNLPEVQVAVAHVLAGMKTQDLAQDKLWGDIRKTPVFTVEYNLTRQVTTNNKNITATEPNQKIPDLSNVNFVYEQGFAGKKAPEITFNVGGTWFNSPNTAEPKRGRVRDFRASLEADWQITGLSNSVKPTLSLSGQYLNLFEEPLGQKVTVNGVTIDRRGPMEVFQVKLSIPVAGSGVKIPISFTYASRTELVKESDKRGNIGITFDFDTLFAKSK